jgi:hypothetical protein
VLRRWERAGVTLWITSLGPRPVDYQADRLQLRAMMMVSAAERDASTTRLQRGRINKGVLQGNGNPGPRRWGFMTDPVTGRPVQDPEATPAVQRCFELADSAECLDEKGFLSIRGLRDRLAQEGIEVSRAKLHSMLRDPIHFNGEFTVHVRGVLVEQPPVVLENPVAADRWQRIQDLLSLRRGGSKNTDIGEFLLNYVECLHGPCQGSVGHDGTKVALRGYVDPRSPDRRLLKHSAKGPLPEPCRGRRTIIERDLLEPPVVRKLREIAQDPDYLEELAAATRHENGVIDGGDRLTDEQRHELKRQIQQLEHDCDAASDAYVDKVAAGAKVDLDDYSKLMSAFRKRIGQLRCRLDADAASVPVSEQDASQARRLRTFLDILTVETPADPRHKALRARLFQRCVSRVIIDDSDSEQILITLEGHLIPGTSRELSNPLLAAGELLDAIGHDGG